MTCCSPRNAQVADSVPEASRAEIPHRGRVPAGRRGVNILERRASTSSGLRTQSRVGRVTLEQLHPKASFPLGRGIPSKPSAASRARAPATLRLGMIRREADQNQRAEEHAEEEFVVGERHPRIRGWLVEDPRPRQIQEATNQPTHDPTHKSGILAFATHFKFAARTLADLSPLGDELEFYRLDDFRHRKRWSTDSIGDPYTVTLS